MCFSFKDMFKQDNKSGKLILLEVSEG